MTTANSAGIAIAEPKVRACSKTCSTKSSGGRNNYEVTKRLGFWRCRSRCVLWQEVEAWLDKGGVNSTDSSESNETAESAHGFAGTAVIEQPQKLYQPASQTIWEIHMKKTLILVVALSLMNWALPGIGKMVTISYAQDEPSPDEKPAPKPAPKPEPKPESE